MLLDEQIHSCEPIAPRCDRPGQFDPSLLYSRIVQGADQDYATLSPEPTLSMIVHFDEFEGWSVEPFVYRPSVALNEDPPNSAFLTECLDCGEFTNSSGEAIDTTQTSSTSQAGLDTHYEGGSDCHDGALYLPLFPSDVSLERQICPGLACGIPEWDYMPCLDLTATSSGNSEYVNQDHWLTCSGMRMFASSDESPLDCMDAPFVTHLNDSLPCNCQEACHLDMSDHGIYLT